MTRNPELITRLAAGKATLPGQSGLHSLSRRLPPHMGLAACILCVWASSVLSFQQSSEPKEMAATIQTYWPRTQFTLRAEANLVEIGVVVRDRRGRTIGGLTRDDFEIEDVGKKREITTFSVETATRTAAKPSGEEAAVGAGENARPILRYVALLFDDFSLPHNQQVLVKAAARRFVKEGLAEGDRVGLFTTSGRQILPFTADVAKLVAAVDQYSSFPRLPDGGICPKLTQYDAYLIANKIDYETYKIKATEKEQCFSGRRSVTASRPPATGSFANVPMSDALMVQAVTMWAQVRDISARALDTMENLVDYMGQLPGRRMVLLASSGLLVRTVEADQQRVINHALRARVVINALDGKGLYTEDPPEAVPGADPRSLMRMVSMGGKEKDLGNDFMSTLAMSTGGLFFQSNNDLDLGFRELGVMPDVSYLLGFSPQEVPNGKYHGLKVRMRSKNSYMIQARPGYWAVAKQQEPPARERRVDREIMGSDTVSEFAAVVSSEPAKLDNGNPALEIVFNVDAKKFHFVEKDGLRTQRLTIIAALFDDNGSFATGTELNVHFALKESTFSRMTETGLEMSVTLQAPPGAYRLRGVAQDGIEGKLIASTLPVQLR